MDLLIKIFLWTPILTFLSIFLGLLYKGFDRKLHARLQWRVGPPLKQPFLDVRKLLSKKNLVPENAITWLYHLMPILALGEVVTIFLFIPIGNIEPVLSGFGDLIVILYLLTGPALFMALGAFASGAPYATIGGQREMVTMMSYEFPLGLSIATIAWIISKSGVSGPAFSLQTYMANPIWGLVNPLGAMGLILFLVVLLAVTPAELSKIPFDVPEAETEIAEGLLSEYSARNLAMFYVADGVKTIAMAAVIVTIFFPYNLSIFIGLTGLLGTGIDVLFFLFKVFAVVFVSVIFIRTAVARLKIDQVSKVFWYPISVISLTGLLLVSISGGLM